MKRTSVAGANTTMIGADRGIAMRPLCFLWIGLIASSLVADSRARAQEAAPAKKDSSARLQPKSVTWTTKVEPATAKPGETVKLTLSAQLQPGWHIYKLTKAQPESGPRQTELDFFDKGGLTPSGEWTASKPLKKSKEAAFPELEFVEYWDGSIDFSIDLKVPADAATGEKSLKVQAYYQLCNDTNCSIPGRWTLPAAKLTITGGQAAAPASAPAPVAAAPVEPAKSPEAIEIAQAAPAQIRPRVSKAESSTSIAEAQATPVAAMTDVQKSLDEGLIPFLLVCAGGGLVALIMPCVWPMVPVTVNFFVKQGQNGAGTTKLAVAYCLAIIGIFTMVGVAFSAFFGAASLQTVANHPYLNFFIAALFFAFGLSLLGLFEIRLPSFLLNASAKGEGKGGMVGVMFMAATLTITSFTCTFPVVGGLLVMASKGNYLYPVLGLATFATVIAIPFFLLALSPSLLAKMPRGGDWMNTVKTVGGLIEVGAAFKFLNTAEIAYTVPEEAWFDAQTVLSIWVVLSAVCGLYLLGFFRTDHDYEEPKVGAGRMLFGCSFLFLALYMAPALFGRPPQSQIYSRLIVGILPPDAGELGVMNIAAAGPGESGSANHGTKATSPDPQVALTQQTSFHGVLWGFSLEQAKEKAKAEKKPILIDFTGVNCANCRLMEQRVLPRPEVVDRLKNFVTVQIYTDIVPIPSITPAQRLELAQANQELLIDLAQEATNPIYVVMDADGNVLERVGGYNEPAAFVDFLNRALGKFSPTKMAAN